MASARAFLSLYRVTGEREWIAHANAAAGFIEERFLRVGGGFASAARGTALIAPLPNVEENMSAARFFNLLAHYSGDSGHLKSARHALSWLGAERNALARLSDAGILLADDEIGSDPLHLTILGPKSDANARALFEAALRVLSSYKRLDWWDHAEGPLPNPDIEYPKLKRSAAFVCTERRCSTPISNPDDIATFLSEN